MTVVDLESVREKNSLTRHSDQGKNISLSEKSAVPSFELLDPSSFGIDVSVLESQVRELLGLYRCRGPENVSRSERRQIVSGVRILGEVRQLSLIRDGRF